MLCFEEANGGARDGWRYGNGLARPAVINRILGFLGPL